MDVGFIGLGSMGKAMAESVTLAEEPGVSAPGFRLALGLKDVRLALAAGDHAQVPLPLASLLRDQHLDAIAHGDGDKDWTALAEVTRRRAGM